MISKSFSAALRLSLKVPVPLATVLTVVDVLFLHERTALTKIQLGLAMLKLDIIGLVLVSL